jgi:pimeloyl-ACP methyl ester carboxylesterase
MQRRRSATPIRRALAATPPAANPVRGLALAETVDVAETLRRRPDAFSGGRMIPVQTAHGTFKVWTKRCGDNPRIKLLLLHGGPGCTHEYFEAFDSYLPQAGVEYYYYDQLGSHRSSQPDVPELWETARFVDEVEQVRQALPFPTWSAASRPTTATRRRR